MRGLRSVQIVAPQRSAWEPELRLSLAAALEAV
jgi:hypothetical protein